MSLRKILLVLSTALLVLVIGLAGSWAWLVHSESGARWIFSQAQKNIPGKLIAETVSGSLNSGLRLEQLQFDDGSMRVDLAQLSLTVGLDILPLTLKLETLQADTVRVSKLESAAEPAADEGDSTSLSMPVHVAFSDIRINDLEYRDAVEESVFVVDSLEASGSLDEDLRLDHIVVRVPGNELAASGFLGLATPHALAIELQASGEFELKGQLTGDLEAMHLDLDSTHPLLQVDGTVKELLRDPAWDLDIASSRIQWPLESPEPDVVLSRLQAQSNGTLSDFKVDLSADIELDGLAPSLLQFAGEGSSDGFTAHALTLAGPELALQATGSLNWLDQLTISLETRLDRLAPEKWVADWPPNHPVTGELGVNWAGGDLDVSHFELAVADTALSVQGSTLIDLEAGIVNGQLRWSDLDWPIGSITPAISSSQGQLQLSGEPDDWSLSGEFELQASDFPAGRLRLDGSGDRHSLAATIHQGSALGGTVAGDVALDWQGNQAFSAKLALSDIDLAPLYPEYPALISTRLTASGQLKPLEVSVSLEQLEGTVDGLPVRANGGFHYGDSGIRADGLNLQSGDATLSLDGSLYELEGLEFQTQIDSLARFSSDLDGAIAAAGKLSLHPQSPKFAVTLSGQELSLGAFQVEQIETRNRPGPDGNPSSEFVMSGVQTGSRRIETLSIFLAGQQPLEHLALGAIVDDTTVTLELDGAIDDWAAPFTSGWAGQLSLLRIDYQEKLSLALDGPAGIEWTPGRFSLEQACLSGTRDARLCVESSWAHPDALRISAEINALPVALAELFVETEAHFSQVLSGTLNWSQSPGARRNGNARIEVSPGSISLPDDDEILLETGHGLFGFVLEDGRVSGGNLDLDLPGNGAIDIDFSISDASLGADSPIQGIARIDLNDIGIAQAFIPLFDTVDGVLDIDLALSGSISDPIFDGKAALSGGRLENLASGFSFVDVNLSGDVREYDRSELQGSFRAGAGTGSISASLDFRDVFSPVISITVKGDSLTVIDVPDLKVIANPDITLGWANKTLDINGRLLIPNARLSPSYLPQSSVRQSEDVVITAGELPAAEPDFLKENEVKFRGNLDVELGNEVSVVLEFARVSVNGKTSFNWQDDLIPLGNGNFDLDGEIQAYGQLLQITRGRIGFPGTSADNPHLNIRAEREIYGNVQIRKAGLMVAGTVQRPILEAYTVPMTNKDRAQTLLITGSDFNYEQGVGAVNVGLYILPKLYISYGIGVFEDGNVISARYDLGRGLGVKATSGQRDTGLDISYTIDR